MRRKTTILDVLRAGEVQASPARRKQGEGDKGGNDQRRGGGRRGRRSAGLSQFETYMRSPSAVPRFVWALLLLVGAAALTGSYFWGHQRGVKAGERIAGTSGQRETRPGRMNRNGPNGMVRTAASSKAVAEGVQGFRIETYGVNERNRPLRDALLAYLREQLAGEEARVVNLSSKKNKQWIVAVLFTGARRADPGYQAELWQRLRGLPAPDPRKVKIRLRQAREGLHPRQDPLALTRISRDFVSIAGCLGSGPPSIPPPEFLRAGRRPL